MHVLLGPGPMKEDRALRSIAQLEGLAGISHTVQMFPDCSKPGRRGGLGRRNDGERGICAPAGHAGHGRSFFCMEPPESARSFLSDQSNRWYDSHGVSQFGSGCAFHGFTESYLLSKSQIARTRINERQSPSL